MKKILKMRKIKMMNKLLVVGCLAVCSSTMAAQVLETPNVNKWDLQFKAFSVNDKLIQNTKNIKLGYQVQGTYNFDKNLYSKGSVAMYRHGKFGYALFAGAQQSMGMFRPYAEFGYQFSYDENDNKSHSFVYDAGTNIVISPKVTAWVEFDNFVQKGKEAITIGSSYKFKSNMGIGGDFQYEASTKNNNADLFLNYSF